MEETFFISFIRLRFFKPADQRKIPIRGKVFKNFPLLLPPVAAHCMSRTIRPHLLYNISKDQGDRDKKNIRCYCKGYCRYAFRKLFKTGAACMFYLYTNSL